MLSIFVYDNTVALAKRYITGSRVMDEAHLEMASQACWDAVIRYKKMKRKTNLFFQSYQYQ